VGATSVPALRSDALDVAAMWLYAGDALSIARDATLKDVQCACGAAVMIFVVMTIFIVKMIVLVAASYVFLDFE